MIVGTAGHIDHGKTALIGALTGVDTDRLAEEKARGISIDLGFAYLPLADGGSIGFVDVPGHERLVHTMLAGAGGIDAALLVIAADDGVMPQTREHLAILDLLRVRHGVVALSKADRADATLLESRADEIAALLRPTALADAPVIAVSSIARTGIAELRAALDAIAARVPGHDQAGAFRLSVDRSFALPGAGTVVTGTVLSGRVQVGDTVLVSPTGLPARVRAIHAQNHAVVESAAGARCALNLAGEDIRKEAIRRGDVVLDPVLHAPTARLDVSLRVLDGDAKPVGLSTPARLHLGAAAVDARILPLADRTIAPGDAGPAQLTLRASIAACAGDRFVLRDPASRRTIGGGVVLDPHAPARGRRVTDRLAQLDALATPDAAAALAGLVKVAPQYADLAAFARDRALPVDMVVALASAAGQITWQDGQRRLAMPAADAAQLRRDIIASLAAWHQARPDEPGQPAMLLRAATRPAFDSDAFRAWLLDMARAGDIALAGNWARLPGHAPRLAGAEEALWARVRGWLTDDSRFNPLRVRDIAIAERLGEAQLRALMKRLARLGQVHEVALDHFFLRLHLDELVQLAARLEDGSGPFSAAQFRDATGIGRKVAIQILEFLDRHGVCVRRGDLRRVDRRRLAFFAPSEPEKSTH